MYYHLNQFDQVIADYSKAIQIDPQVLNAYSNRGSVLRRQKKYSAALIDLNKAIELAPMDPIALYNRELTYPQSGDKERAIADYRRVLELKPDPEVLRRAEQGLEELGAR